MCNSCATQEHMFSAFYVTFSDLGQILVLLLLQCGYHFRTEMLGYLLPKLMEQLCAEQGHV